MQVTRTITEQLWPLTHSFRYEALQRGEYRRPIAGMETPEIHSSEMRKSETTIARAV